ncbi:MAG TPA: ABC transporter permease subunit [Phycisphaerae bacterium]|nr:ABC transporter permease subunit [Phycisphaerae bacterium]
MRAIVDDIAVSLWRLLPANPIVVRVVQGGSRRVQHLWVRALYLLILFFVMLVSQLSQSSAGKPLGELAKGSSQIFSLISVLQLAMMCFLAPVFAAGAISQEKDAETFNVLLTTPLTNAQIVLGSLMSRLYFVVTLLLAGLPIFCITMLFGGVTTDQILMSFGIAGCTAILTGSLAILISVVRVGTRGTVFSFYVGIALYLAIGLGLGYLPATIVQASVVPGVSKGMTWLTLVHPYWALMVALSQTIPPAAAAVAHYPWPLNRMLAEPQTAYMVLTLLVSVVLVGLATVFVRSGAKQGELGWLRKRVRNFWHRGEGERTRRVRRVWSNPIAWREAVTRDSAASSTLMRYSYLGCGILVGIFFLISYGKGEFATVATARAWLTWIVMIEFMVVLLMAVNTAATAVTRERDDNTIELLLVTPLTSRYIIWGKLRGLVSFAVPLMAVPAATVMAVAIYDLFDRTTPPAVSIVQAIVLPVLLAAYAALACMLGLHMSLKSRRSVTAVLASIGVLIVAGFGLGLCALGAVSATPHLGSLFAPFTFATAIFFAVDPEGFLTNVGGMAGMSRLAIEAFMTIGTIIAAALYGAITAGVYRSMVANFDMTIRKQST